MMVRERVTRFTPYLTGSAAKNFARIPTNLSNDRVKAIKKCDKCRTNTVRLGIKYCDECREKWRRKDDEV